jgi:hypothetical protein
VNLADHCTGEAALPKVADRAPDVASDREARRDAPVRSIVTAVIRRSSKGQGNLEN